MTHGRSLPVLYFIYTLKKADMVLEKIVISESVPPQDTTWKGWTDKKNVFFFSRSYSLPYEPNTMGDLKRDSPIIVSDSYYILF